MKGCIYKTTLFSILLILSIVITGCRDKEEEIREKMLSYVEEKYSENFEIVDYNYNKTYKCYEIGVQTDKIKDGLAAEVDYYPQDGIYDGFYSSLYLSEVTKAFQSVLNLPGKNYIFSEYLIDMMGPQDKKSSYEEYKEFMNVDNAVITINVYCESEAEDSKIIMQAVSGAVESLKNPNCDVDVYLVPEGDLSDIKGYVTTHYRRYDSDDLLKRYAYDFRVKKREGVISLLDK